MKLALGMLIALGALAGCSSTQRSRTPDEVFAAMHDELARAVPRADALEEMDDQLAHTVGTTFLTSATLVASDSILSAPVALPDSRMSLRETNEPAPQTWGTDLVSEIPDTRD